jgi:hypothetical protein
MYETRQYNTRIYGSVHKRVEVIVREWLSTQARDLARPAIVSTQHEKDRRLAYPRVIGNEICDRLALVGIDDMHDVRLLQIALRWRRKCACEKELQQLIAYWSGRITAMRAMFQHASQRMGTGLVFSKRYFYAEALVECTRDAR